MGKILANKKQLVFCIGCFGGILVTYQDHRSGGKVSI